MRKVLRELVLLVVTAFICFIVMKEATPLWGILGFFAIIVTEWFFGLVIASFRLRGRSLDVYIPIFLVCTIIVGVVSTISCFEKITLFPIVGLWVIISFVTFVCVGLLAAIQYYSEMKESRRDSYKELF